MVASLALLAKPGVDDSVVTMLSPPQPSPE